jgi:hypothetical protein
MLAKAILVVLSVEALEISQAIFVSWEGGNSKGIPHIYVSMIRVDV